MDLKKLLQVINDQTAAAAVIICLKAINMLIRDQSKSLLK